MDQEQEITFLKALEQHQQKLLRICSVYAEDADDKKDLFQEVLINIWQALPSFEKRSSMSTWMFRITLNVCLRLRATKTRNRNRFMKLESIAIGNVEGDETSSEEHEQLIKLRKCIKKLNGADKAVITLYLEELPYKEISEITGLTDNHVAVMIRRIKRKLLNCITKGNDRG